LWQEVVLRKIYAMDGLIITLIIIGLIVYGLERNRRRQAQPRSGFVGSVNFADRDRERILSDLRTRY
jgi:hypothetical protein